MSEPDREVTTQQLARLESELKAAYRTIDLLIDKLEARTSEHPAMTEFTQLAERVKHLFVDSADGDDQRRALQTAQVELLSLVENLDRTVKARTRALTASETQLREKNHELEKQSRAKAEFIAIVAHELRTPLTSVVGYLEMIAAGRFGQAPAAMARPVASLMRNANRLKRLVDEMLEVNRIDAGGIKLNLSWVSPDEIIREVISELLPLATGKEQSVEGRLADVGTIFGDGDCLHRIVVNLLSNAIRYTPAGGTIILTLDEAPAEDYPGGWIRLRVRDNGIGIAEEDRHRIFEPFTHLPPSKHHTSSGPDSAGLGLYIGRGLIEAHGGFITVASELDEFTEFTVLLPRTRS
jgi:signal transduction histidine kinase